jgi:molecular chaperone GrpE (heat shock protein)
MKKEVELLRKRMDSVSAKNKKSEDRCNKFKTTIANLRDQLAYVQEDYANLRKRRTNQ